MVIKGSLEKKLYRKAVKKRSIVLLLSAWFICKMRWIFKPTADKVAETVGSAVVVAMATTPFFINSKMSANDICFYGLFIMMGIAGIFLPADVLDGLTGDDDRRLL